MVIASDRPVAYSFSALNNFETCPKQFWHMRVKKDYKDKGNDDSNYGNQVHDAIAKYILRGTKLPLDMKHLQPIIDVYKKSAFQQVIVEQKLAINADYEPTGWFDSDVYCRAVIDAGFIQGDLALLVDWKTGNMKPDSEATQLNLSACLFMLHEPEVNRVAMRYVWLKDKGKITPFTLHRSEMPTVWNMLSPRVKRYQHAHKTTDFPAQPSGLCRKHCPITSCPHYGGT